VRVFLSYHVKDRRQRTVSGLRAAGLDVVDPVLDADRANLFERAAGSKAPRRWSSSSPRCRRIAVDAEEPVRLTLPRFEDRVVPVVARPTKDLP
jgi:hypothetical protein